jgi:hypothetical protein
MKTRAQVLAEKRQAEEFRAQVTRENHPQPHEQKQMEAGLPKTQYGPSLGKDFLPMHAVDRDGPTGTRCMAPDAAGNMCKAQQLLTPSGFTCDVGHGGATVGIRDDGVRVSLERCAAAPEGVAAIDELRKASGNPGSRDAVQILGGSNVEAVKQALRDQEVKNQEAAKRRNGLGPGSAIAGDSVTVTSGQDTFTPLPYNTFHVGPFTCTTLVQPGETRAQAMQRAQQTVDEHHRLSFEHKKERFIASLVALQASMVSHGMK